MRDLKKLTGIYAEFMTELGMDLKNPHISGTPERVAKMFLNEFTTAPSAEADFRITTFKRPFNEYVAIKKIPFHSLCEHHHLPMLGYFDVVYHPKKEIYGLSKVVRIINHLCKNPNVQEKLTDTVADFLYNYVDAHGVYIKVYAEHLCMKIRGVHSEGITTTASIRGTIDKKEALALLV